MDSGLNPESLERGRAGDGGLRTILERTGTGNGEKAADTPGVRNAGLDVVRIPRPARGTRACRLSSRRWAKLASSICRQMDASGIRSRRDLPPAGRGEVIRRMPGGLLYPAGHLAIAVRLANNAGKVSLTPSLSLV